jgi:hypothetical protein
VDKATRWWRLRMEQVPSLIIDMARFRDRSITEVVSQMNLALLHWGQSPLPTRHASCNVFATASIPSSTKEPLHE